MNVKKTVFVLAAIVGLAQGLAEPKCDLRGGAAEGADAAICNGHVNGVRIETLSDGWTFRLEGETAERSVRVPHDWGVEVESWGQSPRKAHFARCLRVMPLSATSARGGDGTASIHLLEIQQLPERRSGGGHTPRNACFTGLFAIQPSE